MEIASLIRLRLRDPTRTWSHVINLSAHDFPIKPLWKLEAFLSSTENKNASFIAEEIGTRLERQKFLWSECDRPGDRYEKMIMIGTRRNPLEEFDTSNYMYNKPFDVKYTPMEGSQWHILR